MQINSLLSKEWMQLLKDEFSKPYFLRLKQFVEEENNKYKIYPPEDKIFAAFDMTPPEILKVVILGQDPYHGDNQANGLCFSVSDGIKQPPSLKNIIKELNNDTQDSISITGNLESWAKQGILLLNTTLTVRAGEPLSHKGMGWETFTDEVIKKISINMEDIIFILWGQHAHGKENFIDTTKHTVLKAAHPSPFSAYKGFFGCKHFTQINEILRNSGKKEINWKY